MTRKRISGGDTAMRTGSTPLSIRVCVVTMDTHLASATARAPVDAASAWATRATPGGRPLQSIGRDTGLVG